MLHKEAVSEEDRVKIQECVEDVLKAGSPVKSFVGLTLCLFLAKEQSLLS